MAPARGMRIWTILGGGGFSGTRLARYLLSSFPDIHVTSIGRHPEKPPPFSDQPIDDARYDYLRIDLACEPEQLLKMLDARRPEIIVNLAAEAEEGASWISSWRFFETNLVALSKIVEQVIGAPWLRKWIQIGSAAVYGSGSHPVTEDAILRPSTPYAVSKAAADLYLSAVTRAHDFRVNVIRPSNIYGRGQQLHRIIPKAVLCALLGRKLFLDGGGLARKSYLHVEDFSRAIYLVAEGAPSGRVYNAGPQNSTSVRAVVDLVCRKLGVPFDDMVEIAPDRVGQDAEILLDTSRIAADVGWSPTIDLDTGLEDTIAWVKQNLDVLKDQPTEYAFSG
jgi:dTDP-glucose 4,6-dehydratase